jgi:hypothetical protein
LLKIDVFWAETQNLNYLLWLMDEMNRSEEDSKPKKASNAAIMAATAWEG